MNQFSSRRSLQRLLEISTHPASIQERGVDAMPEFNLPATGEHRLCPHGFHHPPWPHSCDGCWCEGESDRRNYGWDHDTTPVGENSNQESSNP